MATITTGSSLDEYYDLTVEEEALLCSVDIQATSLSDSSALTGGRVFSEDSQSHVFATSVARCGSGDREPGTSPGPLAAPTAADAAVSDALYPDLTNSLTALPVPQEPAEKRKADPDTRDDRSLLQRFRTYPRKPFSVSDFTSGGAWCELQYYFTLTRLPGGKKTRTAAMKGGSKVHKKLEDEVHTTVRVEIETKEDVFGLKLWNVIQGLRTLRDTGLTREMEVWGMVDGNLVNGIIDSLSYSCPNEEFEEEILMSQGEGEGKRRDRTIYLSDIKTRGSKKPPSGAASLRPTKIQLFLYHRLLSEMISGKLDFMGVLRRLDIAPDEPFSDAFLAQVGSLHDDVFSDAEPLESQEEEGSESEHPLGLVRYRTVRELLALLREELRLTFVEDGASLGRLVSVDYRYREDGSIIGTNTFPVDDGALGFQLESDLEWWRGEREPRGVDIEDAFKCGYCEFAGDCGWREGMEKERLERARRKVEAAGGYR